MSDHEHDNKTRDLKIAENEASRELASDVRLTIWAIGVAVILAIGCIVVFVLMRK